MGSVLRRIVPRLACVTATLLALGSERVSGAPVVRQGLQQIRTNVRPTQTARTVKSELVVLHDDGDSEIFDPATEQVVVIVPSQRARTPEDAKNICAERGLVPAPLEVIPDDGAGARQRVFEHFGGTVVLFNQSTRSTTHAIPHRNGEVFRDVSRDMMLPVFCTHPDNVSDALFDMYMKNASPRVRGLVVRSDDKTQQQSATDEPSTVQFAEEEEEEEEQSSTDDDTAMIQRMREDAMNKQQTNRQQTNKQRTDRQQTDTATSTPSVSSDASENIADLLGIGEPKGFSETDDVTNEQESEVLGSGRRHMLQRQHRKYEKTEMRNQGTMTDNNNKKKKMMTTGTAAKRRPLQARTVLGGPNRSSTTTTTRLEKMRQRLAPLRFGDKATKPRTTTKNGLTWHANRRPTTKRSVSISKRSVTGSKRSVGRRNTGRTSGRTSMTVQKTKQEDKPLIVGRRQPLQPRNSTRTKTLSTTRKAILTDKKATNGLRLNGRLNEQDKRLNNNKRLNNKRLNNKRLNSNNNNNNSNNSIYTVASRVGADAKSVRAITHRRTDKQRRQLGASPVPNTDGRVAVSMLVPKTLLESLLARQIRDTTVTDRVFGRAPLPSRLSAGPQQHPWKPRWPVRSTGKKHGVVRKRGVVRKHGVVKKVTTKKSAAKHTAAKKSPAKSTAKKSPVKPTVKHTTTKHTTAKHTKASSSPTANRFVVARLSGKRGAFAKKQRKQSDRTFAVRAANKGLRRRTTVVDKKVLTAVKRRAKKQGISLRGKSAGKKVLGLDSTFLLSPK